MQERDQDVAGKNAHNRFVTVPIFRVAVNDSLQNA